MYQKIVSQKPRYFYLLVRIEFDRPITNFSEVLVRNMSVQALLTLFGQAGAAIIVDVLRVDEDTGECILRAPAEDIVRVWSSLTVLAEYNKVPCRIDVLQASAYLMGLAYSSRRLRIGQ
eukprot:comp11943_c0_seq1/m.6615 comp11943_c0_seq1/g.6615  ORF comp11943_c0_seq1/g.6615 comp11943_c0_seq1/m.6615 type:complete len:119 (-) comp11943_c0_seq1:272-628(-)